MKSITLILALLSTFLALPVLAEPPKPTKMTREETSDLRAAFAASEAVEAKCREQRLTISADIRRVSDLMKRFDLHMTQAGELVEKIELNRESAHYGEITRNEKPKAGPATPAPKSDDKRAEAPKPPAETKVADKK